MTKYRAIRTNGYHSRKEAARAEELKLLLKMGVISNLREQVKFELVKRTAEHRGLSYIADFCYLDEFGQEVTSDVKGYHTDIYRVKKLLMSLKEGEFIAHGITITEV